MSWIAPRIWRSAKSRFNDDEPLHSAEVYTPETLAEIKDQGFDAIWMRGRLWDMIRSTIYPELNDPQAQKRIENLQNAIAEGKKLGIDVYLYFNEPMALLRTHEFWKRHPELAGEPFVEPELDWDMLAFCTSTPQFKEFFAESVGNLFDDLNGLGGVILITASEFHTHCWSHRARRSIGDKYLDKCLVDVECPNCCHREPAEVVGELVNVWKMQADKQALPPRVWAWNWSWSIWYDPPQREVIEALPDGVELMCDFERGGLRKQAIGEVAIDEYSLGYVGPSEQFKESHNIALKRNMPMCAKLQIGTTHELSTVPNLPLIPNLFEKLKKADEFGLAGLMCSWNFGNSATLNTAALKLFVDCPDLRKNKEKFLQHLSGSYFGDVDDSRVVEAWAFFCQTFSEYPFSIKMLYHSPMNYAVAYPLKLQYEDREMVPSWIPHSPFGDRLEDCLPPFTLEQVCTCWEKMEALWNQGLDLYVAALVNTENRHQWEELSCARMIGCHLSAMRNIFKFHNSRRMKMQELGLEGPCELPADEGLMKWIQRQDEIRRRAMELCKKDSRLGFHQEPAEYFYSFA